MDGRKYECECKVGQEGKRRLRLRPDKVERRQGMSNLLSPIHLHSHFHFTFPLPSEYALG